jgi:hypothetical protein
MAKKPIKLKSDTEDVLDAFQLKRNVGCASLDEWLDYQTILDTYAEKVLETKRQLLVHEGEFWNEEELKMQFLAFLFDIADINVPEKIKLFYERPLSAIVNGYELSVICDAMVATPKGIGKPKHPYFFLQEFKKQRNAPDAEGQMLIAMLLAQHENQNNEVVYGCYLQGRNWVFTTLQEKNYCVSRFYDAAQKEDLHKIIFALKHLKTLIIKQLKKE